MGFSFKTLIDPLNLSGKQDSPGVSAVADPYGDVRNKLNSWLGSQIGQKGPTYTGETVAPMSEQEKGSLKSLDDYANYDIGKDQTFQGAKTAVNKSLSSNYDPTTDPYYQAVKAQADRNLQQTNKQIASQAAGGGRYYSGARMQQQREAGVDVNNAMNTLMAQQAENERQRQQQNIPLALQLSQYESGIPLQKATAQQTLGALPRTLQQAQDQASLDDWLRSNYQWPTSVANIAGGVQQAPLYQQNAPSTSQQLQSSLMQMAPQLAMMAMMGCWVAAEVFEGGWDDERTHFARYFIGKVGPSWFRYFYLAYGEGIAKFIHNKPVLKMLIKPLFQIFAYFGKKAMQKEAKYAIS